MFRLYSLLIPRNLIVLNHDWARGWEGHRKKHLYYYFFTLVVECSFTGSLHITFWILIQWRWNSWYKYMRIFYTLKGIIFMRNLFMRNYADVLYIYSINYVHQKDILEGLKVIQIFFECSMKLMNIFWIFYKKIPKFLFISTKFIIFISKSFIIFYIMLHVFFKYLY